MRRLRRQTNMHSRCVKLRKAVEPDAHPRNLQTRRLGQIREGRLAIYSTRRKRNQAVPYGTRTVVTLFRSTTMATAARAGVGVSRRMEMFLPQQEIQMDCGTPRF